MKIKAVRRGILAALLALTIVLLLSITTICGGTGGKKRMENVNQTKEITSLTTQTYSIGERFSALSLFPVPYDNAVGTNDYKDSITVISFPRGRMEIDNYFKGAVEDVRGSGTYLPVIGSNTIGFGQTRRFMLYNFKEKTCRKFRIVLAIEESIEKIAIADPQKLWFVFEIEEQNRNSSDPWDFTKSLRLVDLSGKDPKLIKKVSKDKGISWSAAYDMLFLWDFTDNIMWVLDTNFDRSQHPLADVITRNKNKVDFVWMLPHPYLPFAILYGGKRDETVISWGEGRNKTPQPIVDNGKNFSFSPDGKWVAYFREDFKRNKNLTYIMPVSEKYPNFLGTPILLAEKDFGDKNFAWTKNPVSFVCAGGGTLYRWELTNEAHPESDKPTFHDYVVEKDLERLAREKR